MHERRLQGAGGLWVTQQLVSNVPLSEAEALKLLAQMPVGPAETITAERVAPAQLGVRQPRSVHREDGVLVVVQGGAGEVVFF
ncbi:hypothetical protein ABDE16_13605 [Streptomyces sp. BRB040]|uniref:hypothetical protein n=1 Tax=Streptomyces sp. BRB040 TaxID=3142634 RepID=UPI0031F66EEB